MPNTTYFREYRAKNKEKVQAHQRAYYLRNRELVKTRTKSWQKSHPKEVLRSGRKGRLRRGYGISLEQFQQMYEDQNGLCAICCRPEPECDKRTGTRRSLSVDHNHKTKTVRGLLCGSCNRAVGLLEEDILRARALIIYLESYGDQ